MPFFHHRTRHWLPVIVAGLTVVLALVFYATNRQFSAATVSTWFARPPQAVDEAPRVTEDDYRQAVTTIVGAYAVDEDVDRAYNALIALRVPGSMQAFHIDLIIAFGKLRDGDDDARPRLDALMAQNSWFVL